MLTYKRKISASRAPTPEAAAATIRSGPAHQNVSNEPLRLVPRERLAHGARTPKLGEQARNRQAGCDSF